MTLVRLKQGKDRPIRSGHPWIFSGAIDGLDSALGPGDVVDVHAAGGEFLGRGYVNPRCAITVRMLTRADEPIDAAFVTGRVRGALAWRRQCLGGETNAYRLINGEGDRLPGFLVDVYGEFAVLQALTAGAERLKPWLIESLCAEVGCRGIWERSSGNVRREEGLPSIDAPAWGDPPPETLEVDESGHRFLVDLRAGQKTGFYLDQRPNRLLVQQLARGARVLNAFAYTGSFGVYAGKGGATRVVSVESSARALALAERNWDLNHLPPEAASFVQADVFRYLREGDESFDLLILDPPALVKRRADLDHGVRAYKDLNLQAFRRAAPGAVLATFSCSQHLGADLFRKIVHGAATDAGRAVQVLGWLGPGLDHPTSLAHPEGEYLHGLLLRTI